ncbi:MAG: glycerophosphodiester phosphodiesterase family protein [Thermomicrobiales bacterium]
MSLAVIGHRGARFEAPENTLAGFAHAIALGLPAVEFDIRLSRDGELMVIHDATVDRTTNGAGEVSSFTAGELAALDARSGFTEVALPCGVPTFDQVLDLLGPVGMAMFVEIKKDSPEREERIVAGVLERLRARGLADRATITSFDPVALEFVVREAPDQRRGYIGAWDSDAFLDTALRLGCAQADMHHVSASADMVRKAHDAGLTVVGWPCNTQDEVDRLIGWGVDAATSDAPTFVRAALEAVGA